MDMTFHFSDDFCMYIDQWHVQDNMVYAITCLFAVLLAFGREYLAIWREVRHRSKKKRRKRGMINVQVRDDENVTVPLIDSSKASSMSTSSSTSSDPHARLRLTLGGMTCGACVNTIQAALKAETGVVSAVVSLEREVADIVYMPNQIAPAQLVSAVETVGYDAKAVNSEETVVYLSVPDMIPSDNIGAYLVTLPFVEEVSVVKKSLKVRCHCADEAAKASLATNLVDEIKTRGRRACLVDRPLQSGAKSKEWIRLLTDSAIYTVLLGLAYLLMLVFMTYEVGLCLVALGAMVIGYFLAIFSNRYRGAPAEADHCCDK